MRQITAMVSMAIVVSGCGAVAQSLRGEPPIDPGQRNELIGEYVGRAAWTRETLYADKFSREFAARAVGEDYKQDKPYEVAVTGWSKVTIKEILFGSGDMNFVSVVDEAGKTHHGVVHLSVPTYTSMERSQPDFQARVRSDYEYAIGRALAFKSREDLLSEYSERWGPDVGPLVVERQLAVGMPRDAALESWGRPDQINKTLSETGSSEQWVFRRGPNLETQYVYVENGVVTAIQDTQ